jgi:hypothetical protein
MQVIEEEANLSLICQFVFGFFLSFLQTELLLYQNKMMMINTFWKVRQIKTLQSKKTNQVTISSAKQWLLSILKKAFMNFSNRRKSKILIEKY